MPTSTKEQNSQEQSPYAVYQTHLNYFQHGWENQDFLHPQDLVYMNRYRKTSSQDKVNTTHSEVESGMLQ